MVVSRWCLAKGSSTSCVPFRQRLLGFPVKQAQRRAGSRPGDPRVNIQEGKGGKAKDYQVRQVLRAIDKLEHLK